MNERSPLLPGVSQFEVDFVIPRVGVDLPLGIDPFLLFKSRDPSLSQLHSQIITIFNSGIDALRKGNVEQARYILDFPEAPEIGFGNTKKGKRGSGVGTYLTDLIIETLRDSPDLMARGVRHIEEMQLVSVGIGPDRTSDIAANIIKRFLIEYTQRQCETWAIPLTVGVPVGHIMDVSAGIWADEYADLPLSPVDGSPILLVPRRIVRTLPWINYQDFFRLEFAAYLRAKKVKGRSSGIGNVLPPQTQDDKEKIAATARAEVSRLDRYVTQKEADAASAQPSLTYLAVEGSCPEGQELKQRLAAIPTGTEDAAEYQRAVLAILNYLFSPELIDGQMEVKTTDGTERRDIIFTNDSDGTFWSYLRAEHSSLLLMFEIKNVKELTAAAFNQTNTYLGDRLGRLGFIVTRSDPSEAQIRKSYSIYNDSHPRKIILILSNSDLSAMIDMKCAGSDPMRYTQKKYRHFRTSVQ